MPNSHVPLAPMPRDPAAALEAYDPSAGHGPWDARLASHLLRRAVGGARAGRTVQLAKLDPDAALASLFVPADAARTERLARLGRSISAGDRTALAAWWLLKLVDEARAPGTRLTLFWHDHFACGDGKVDDRGMLHAQHELFVRLGEGRFEALLRAVLRDPAMLIYLDGDSNRRGRPNENLARELFELFSLGTGSYRETDIREAARALTGRTVRNGAMVEIDAYHDRGEKRVLGVTVDDGDDLARVATAQAACPRFLVAKLWRFYVSPAPPAEAVDLLAERWRELDLRVDWLVRTLLASRAFNSDDAVGSLVKSPVDYTVGVLRGLGMRPDLREVERACASMGQRLFDPPGVQGWEDGAAWIHSASWLERTAFAARVAGGPSAAGQAARGFASLSEELMPGLLSATRFGSLAKAAEDPGADALHLLLCLPEYHLA